MSDIDLRKGDREFRVPTTVTRNGISYMGPDVLVTGRDVEHALEVVKQAGHTPNHYFPPKEIKK